MRAALKDGSVTSADIIKKSSAAFEARLTMTTLFCFFSAGDAGALSVDACLL